MYTHILNELMKPTNGHQPYHADHAIKNLATCRGHRRHAHHAARAAAALRVEREPRGLGCADHQQARHAQGREALGATTLGVLSLRRGGGQVDEPHLRSWLW